MVYNAPFGAPNISWASVFPPNRTCASEHYRIGLAASVSILSDTLSATVRTHARQKSNTVKIRNDCFDTDASHVVKNTTIPRHKRIMRSADIYVGLVCRVILRTQLNTLLLEMMLCKEPMKRT